jgi:deoxyribonuclease V
MMIAAFDVHYLEDGRASAAAVLFSDYSDSEPETVYTKFLTAGAADYIPGELYRRELPCILTLLKQINKALDEMIVDGYVMLGNKPGLGQHLFESFDGIRPLYLTSAGMEQKKASERIKMMHGAYRVPTLLKRVDLLARENVQQEA